MAGGSLTALASFGAQDVYLTGSPQITFFKGKYMRYTPFVKEQIELTGTNVGFGKRAIFEVGRNGDCVGPMVLKATLPALVASTSTPCAWTQEIGHFMLKQIEFELGGQTMDKHYGFVLSALQELWGTEDHKANYNEMIGNTVDMTTPALSIPSKNLYIPLKFWFNKSPGNYIPLVALQKHIMKINIEFESLSNLVVGGAFVSADIINAVIICDYIFLDTEERRQFARMAHEYLVETIQYTGQQGFSSTNGSQRLSFNHPSPELIILSRLASEESALRLSNFADATGTGHNITSIKLQLNGNDYQREQEARYYNLVSPYQTHTHGPRIGVYVFPFALKPEDYQPSGSTNFSRIDNATIQFGFASSAALNVYTFAIVKNVFRVISGMGGLAYSN